MNLLLPASHRRAEEFALALDSRTTTDPTTSSLFALADELAAMPHGPGVEFRSELRYRLVTLAADPPPSVVRTPGVDRLRDSLASWLTGWRGQRRLAFAAGILVIALLTGAVGLLGSRSGPGDAFYAVKRAAESAQLATAHGKLAKGHRHLEFAAARLREVSALIDRNSALVAAGPAQRPVAGRVALSRHSTRLVLDTLSDMDSEVLAGTRDLTEYWRESGQEPPLHTLDTFAHGQRAKLAAVLPTLPVSARSRGLAALDLLSSVRQRAQELIAQGPCDAGCRRIAGGATMSGGFDALGPLPCPSVCPGSGAVQAPVATVTSVTPEPDSVVSPDGPSSPAASPLESLLESPPSVLSPQPEPSVSPSELASPWLSPSPLPTLSPLPSPVESSQPSPPVDISASPDPSPTPLPEPEASATESPDASAPTGSPVPSLPIPADPTETGSPAAVPSPSLP